jgi:hypothetical protein
MRRSVLAILSIGLNGLGGSGEAPGPEQPGVGLAWLHQLPGTWNVDEVLNDGRSRAAGSYVFATPFANRSVLEMTVRRDGVVTSRGAVGSSDQNGQRLFFMSVGASAQPTAITGRADEATRSIDWVLEPALGPAHPYNHGLVVSRISVTGPDSFVWSAPGHWRMTFRRTQECCSNEQLCHARRDRRTHPAAAIVTCRDVLEPRRDSWQT